MPSKDLKNSYSEIFGISPIFSGYPKSNLVINDFVNTKPNNGGSIYSDKEKRTPRLKMAS